MVGTFAMDWKEDKVSPRRETISFSSTKWIAKQPSFEGCSPKAELKEPRSSSQSTRFTKGVIGGSTISMPNTQKRTSCEMTAAVVLKQTIAKSERKRRSSSADSLLSNSGREKSLKTQLQEVFRIH